MTTERMAPRSAEELDAEYNPDGDGQHPIYTREQWRIDVDQQNTVSGYWQWLADTLEHDEDPRTAALLALRRAVLAKTRYWNAMGALEAAFGYDGSSIPDDISDAFTNCIDNLAGGDDTDDMYWIDNSTLQMFMESTGVTL